MTTTMARLLVLWGTPEDPDFFERHYREVHVPLVQKFPGVRRYQYGRWCAGLQACGEGGRM